MKPKLLRRLWLKLRNRWRYYCLLTEIEQAQLCVDRHGRVWSSREDAFHLEDTALINAFTWRLRQLQVEYRQL